MVGLAYFDSHFAVAYPFSKTKVLFRRPYFFFKETKYSHFPGHLPSRGKMSQEDIGLANAGQYLGEAFGSTMRIVWALGLCAAGQSSTMTGAYAGQWAPRPSVPPKHRNGC